MTLSPTATASLLLVTSASATSAATIVVHPDGTGDAPTIQAAVDIASDGDTIELADGTFLGEGNRRIEVDAKALTIRSASGDPTRCIIDCEGSPAQPNWGFFLLGFEVPVLIEGLTIQNAHDDPELRTELEGSAITTVCTDLTVRDCVIRGNGGAPAVGLGCGPPSRFERTVFTGNEGSAGAIATWGDLDLVSCTFAGNQGLTGPGALYAGFATVTVTDCVFWNNCGSGSADEIFVTDSHVVLSCTILDFDEVAWLITSFVIDDLLEVDPLFCDPAPCTDAPTLDGDDTVDAASMALPAANPCGVLIGALGEGCDVVAPVRGIGWGGLKDTFRDDGR